MCGRFTLRTPAAILKDYFGLPDLPGLSPRYNIAPTQPIGVVRDEGDERHWAELRWGLVPAWAKDVSIGARMINARAETVATKTAFREAFVQRRCVIPADGFFEWRRLDDGTKQPYYFSRLKSEPFAFAGLWECWRDRQSGATVRSCALITTTPNTLVADVHDRMPVMLDRDATTEWLRSDAAPGALDVLLQPFPAEAMQAHPVGTGVNRPVNDDPSCIAPVPAATVTPRLF